MLNWLSPESQKKPIMAHELTQPARPNVDIGQKMDGRGPQEIKAIVHHDSPEMEWMEESSAS